MVSISIQLIQLASRLQARVADSSEVGYQDVKKSKQRATAF